MRRVMATEAGGELYSKRQCMVEPVFAQIKTNRRIEALQTKRPGGRPLGMAPDCRHSQPSEAPSTPIGGRNRLTGPKGPAIFRSGRFTTPGPHRPGFMRQPRVTEADQLLSAQWLTSGHRLADGLHLVVHLVPPAGGGPFGPATFSRTSWLPNRWSAISSGRSVTPRPGFLPPRSATRCLLQGSYSEESPQGRRQSRAGGGTSMRAHGPDHEREAPGAAPYRGRTYA